MRRWIGWALVALPVVVFLAIAPWEILLAIAGVAALVIGIVLLTIPPSRPLGRRR